MFTVGNHSQTLAAVAVFFQGERLGLHVSHSSLISRNGDTKGLCEQDSNWQEEERQIYKHMTFVNFYLFIIFLCLFICLVVCLFVCSIPTTTTMLLVK